MTEIHLYPTEMIEELMYFIMQNEMNGKLDPDHPFMDLYVELQKLLDKLHADRRDMYVSVFNDEVKQ